MRWVQHAAIRPHRCAVIPFIGNSNARRGFIDTGADMREQDHVYISDEAVEQMARLAGFVHGDALVQFRRTLGAENEELKRKLAESEAENERLAEQLAAVRVLKNGGFAQPNPPGRPKKAVAA